MDNFIDNNCLKIDGKIIPENCTHYSNEIRNIMLPLLQPYRIHYFFHERMFNDGKQIAFTTHPEAIYYRYQHHFPTWSRGPCNLSLLQMDHLIWVAVSGKEREVYDFYAKNFNIANGITINEINKDYCDIFHFGADYYDYEIMDFLINNRDLLKYFCAYYKGKFDKVLNKFKHYVYQPGYKINLSALLPYKQLPDSLIDANNISRDVSKLVYGSVKINYRERNILFWLAQGKTAEEVGLILNSSKRTVEAYIKVMKDKLECPNIVSLVSKAIALGIIGTK